MNIISDFFMINQGNPEKEEDLKILSTINHRSTSKSKFQIQKYEKFKPNPKKEINKIDYSIITTENQIKILLSSFLKDLKKEHENEEYSNINKNTQLKRKRTKVIKRKETTKKNSSSPLNTETPVSKLKKIKTISGNKYYNEENKNSPIQTLPLVNNEKNPLNQKSLFLNSLHRSKDNLPNLKKKHSKNIDLNNNDNLISKDFEKSGDKNKTKNSDIYFHKNEINLMRDEEKDQNKLQEFVTKKIKNNKKSKKNIKNSIKNSNKPEINSSLYSEFDLNNIINEKLLKLTGDINKEIVIDEMLKESKVRHSFNNTKNSNIICCSNVGENSKRKAVSLKKNLNISDIDKIENTENINDFQSRSIISNRKGNFNVYIQKTSSYFSSKTPVHSITKKKYIERNILKNLKEQIKNSIILRPEELNLTYDSKINNSQNKIISFDKESLSKSKINNSSSNIDYKNIENNLTNSNKNNDKKLTKKKFYSEDETINNEINENSNNFLENVSQNQEKKSFYSFSRERTEKEITKENFRVLTYKKLVYDSLDDEEVEEEYNNYIHPDSSFIKIFDNIVGSLAFASLIYIPYYLASTQSFCKNYKNPWYVVNAFVEIIYYLDFIFEFFKAYYNFEEQLIVNKMSILKKFLESWFLLDLLSTFPTYSFLKVKEPLCPKQNKIHPYGEVLHNLHYFILLNIESKLENAKFLDLYISSTYSLLTSVTTVGYGDIVCHSLTERIFQIFLLIVGSITYSWLVSSFSNYVQKQNEQYVDFENKIQILDEIKFNYPKMSNDLYERVLRYLKYKNCYEKGDKNKIFDCLPIGLKNNLVYEMYKPIIKNFIFFKNFDNSDFIIKVVLAFRPILAYKNDILLNEGDFVDDIFFVKKGILSVQIPINIKNPEVYIDKYLNGDIIEHKYQQNNSLNPVNHNIFEQKKFLNSIILQQKFNKTSILNLAEEEDLFNRIKRKEEENERKKNTKYIKILSIRENEHFGDVLMLLDQRSPLRVKVISKKAELFFLKKMDVLTISSSYPNIWRRINKKSVFNFEQIKNSIPKIVELYCRLKGFNVNKVDAKITQNKSSKKIINKRTMPPSTKLKIHTLTAKNPKRSLTQQNTKNKIYIDKYFPSKNALLCKYKNYKTHVMNLHKNEINHSDSNNNDDDPDENSKNSDIKNNIENSRTILSKKLKNNYNKQYKYYTGSKIVKESYKSMVSMIKEDFETDSTITLLKTSNNVKNKLSGVVKKSAKSNNDNIKKTSDKNNFAKNWPLSGKILDNINQSQNQIDSKEKRLSIEIFNENDELFCNDNKNIKFDTKSMKKRKQSINDELLSDKKRNSSANYSINDELNINEEVKIPISENLLNRNISKSISLDKKNIIQIQEINNMNEQNSGKIIYSDKDSNKDFNNIRIALDKNVSKINNNKLDNHNKINENNNLTHESVITDLQITSIYDNLNSINNKYFLNKKLQEKVKQLIKGYTEIDCENCSIVKNLSMKKINKFFNNQINNTLYNTNNISTNFLKKNNLESNLINPAISIHKNRFKQRVRSFHGKYSSTFSKLDDKNDSFNYSSEILRKKRNGTNIGDSSPGKTIFLKQNTNRICSHKKQNYNISRAKSVINCFDEKDSLYSLKNIMMHGSNFLNRKRKSNLLSTINLNIENNSHNIYNPNEFYSFYFQSFLKKEKKNAERYMMSSDFSPRFRRNKK